MWSPPPKNNVATRQMNVPFHVRALLANVLRELPEQVQRRQNRPLLQTIRTMEERRPLYATPPLQILRNYPEDARRVHAYANIRLLFSIQDEDRTKDLVFEYTGRADNIRDAINAEVNKYLQAFPPQYTSIDDVIVVLRDDNARKIPYDYAANRMRAEQPFDISVNLFNNTIHIKPTEENCVKTFLRSQYPAISTLKKDPIGNLGTDDGVTSYELLEFCRHYHIRMIAYNIRKQVIAKYNPPIPNNKYKSLYFISYNNHIYPIKHKYLEEKPKQDTTLQNLSNEELREMFQTLLSNNILPTDIQLDRDEVRCFRHENKLYFSNDQFDQCYQILKQFGIEDKITPTTTLTNVHKLLEPLYTQEHMDSFLPIHHTKPAFWYNKQRDPTKSIETIDKNKAYSYILKTLPYLLTTDYRTNPIQTYPFELTKDGLYIAEPEIPNILMPTTDIYTGRHLLYCKGKFVFKLKEKLPCTTKSNFYTTLIDDLYYHLPEDQAKKIIVRMIGSFQSEPTLKTTFDALLVNNEELNQSYDHIPYDNTHSFEIQPRQYTSHIYNRKPIAIQVKDEMNRLLYEKMIELNIHNEDIVQINTDSITFYTNPTTKKIRTQKTLDGWKQAEFKQKSGSIFDQQQGFNTFKLTSINDNELITGPAGNGKSHYIKHNLAHGDYIILSSKHSAITQHRNNNLTTNVIQYYEFTNTIPTQNHIIVEECGILSRQQWDVLFKCFLHKKKLTVLGDFNQLLPPQETAPFSSPHFLSYIFSKQSNLNTNYRNNFSLDYYTSLQTSQNPDYLKHEILKYSTTKPEDADVIIAYRNIIVDKYNDYMLAYHNKTTADPDVPMICKDNELKDKNIYNQFILLSQDIEPSDKRHFKPAYARTLYNMQGDQTLSYYIAPEDIHFFTKPREAYTLISRLSQPRV